MRRYTIDIDGFTAVEGEPFPDFYTALTDSMDRYIEFRRVHDDDLDMSDPYDRESTLEAELRQNRGFKIVVQKSEDLPFVDEPLP